VHCQIKGKFSDLKDHKKLMHICVFMFMLFVHIY
jgi:hypothetical protein